jgi:hypothetical protein
MQKPLLFAAAPHDLVLVTTARLTTNILDQNANPLQPNQETDEHGAPARH